ncbi:hypothetical protein IH970_10770 [candidate division KSB1 bacterium]|nr:hypothetical protein [candidate division KSB1 bacterium]
MIFKERRKKKLFQKTKPAPKVSAYGEEPKKKPGRWLLIAIIAVSIIFIGLLIAFLLST